MVKEMITELYATIRDNYEDIEYVEIRLNSGRVLTFDVEAIDLDTQEYLFLYHDDKCENVNFDFVESWAVKFV